MDSKKRLAWFVLIRVVVVTLFLLTTIILGIKEPEGLGSVTLAGLTKLVVATYLFSLVCLIILKLSDGLSRLLPNIQIVWDLLLVTLLILFTGGVTSPYSFLYILPIINASYLLGQREATYTASLCSILYGAIIDLQYYGRLLELGLSQIPARDYGAGHIFYALFINILVFYLVAFVTGYLAARAVSSETALYENVINYEELERLNTLIVTNIDSGLLTINKDGLIRVFNHYAATIIGISLQEAYDRPLGEVIPAFLPLAGNLYTVRRGEITHQRVDGVVILGFKSIPFPDKEGERVGCLIEFQDLTQLKRMEAQLKKVDRLAALGELSAHLAHEIRNPLASISGSVQLIALDRGIAEKDKQLLEIVLRETDRLNGLISDFLGYAHPPQPMKVPLALSAFIDNLTALLMSDSRFERVTILNECLSEVVVAADRNQMQQVFWNLAVNAAESMTGGGIIAIKADTTTVEGEDGKVDVVKVEVRDNGSGMARENVTKVFEPFFTTKQRGTGLGLATVYRIIESHGGTISVESERGVGTGFTITLPAGIESTGKR